MENFIQCLCYENLKALVIDGMAGEDELRETWVLILSEYYDLRGDEVDGTDQWQLSRDATQLQNHLFLLGLCIEFLKIRWSDSIAASVRKLGYPFNPADRSNYQEDMNRVVNKSKTKYVQLRQFIKQLEEQVKKMGDKKPSREYFDNLLIHIEEMQKVSYTMETITVQKFILLEKKYFKQVEYLKQRASKHV